MVVLRKHLSQEKNLSFVIKLGVINKHYRPANPLTVFASPWRTPHSWLASSSELSFIPLRLHFKANKRSFLRVCFVEILVLLQSCFLFSIATCLVFKPHCKCCWLSDRWPLALITIYKIVSRREYIELKKNDL